MLRFALLCLSLALFSSGTLAAEYRCGWYDNPSAANLFLRDKDGEWAITSQNEANGPNAQNWEDLPPFDESQSVSLHQGNGYGCACLLVETNRKTMHITKFISGKTLALAKCRADRSLPKPN